MKQLNQFITEYIIKKKLDTPIDSEDHYEYHPKSKDELKKNIIECIKNDKYDLNCIDTSKITDMSYLFGSLNNVPIQSINFDVSEWDVSNVKRMGFMFNNCKNFNCDLSNWDVSNVNTMERMFYGCEIFEGKGLENWNVSNVDNMSNMFYNCKKFDCDLSNWNISNVKFMERMFYNCKKFKVDCLENWKITTKVSKKNIFYGTKNTPSWYKK